MALTEEEKRELFELGEKEEKEGKVFGSGPPLRVFESTAQYEERKDIYDAGRQNVYKK